MKDNYERNISILFILAGILWCVHLVMENRRASEDAEFQAAARDPKRLAEWDCKHGYGLPGTCEKAKEAK